MKRDEIRELARAVSCWLSYKDLTGFQNQLTEAMLSLPISEFLASKEGWILRPEVSYRTLCKTTEVPDLYCDFAGTRKFGTNFQFILEAKFLRGKIQNRIREIADDMIRLSLPTDSNLLRLMLLAGRADHFHNSEGSSLFGENVFKLRPQEETYIKFEEQLAKPEFIKAFPVFQNLVSIGGVPWLAKYGYLKCRANESSPSRGESGYMVLIWSVGRSKRIQ